MKPVVRWGVLWRARNALDGERAHLVFEDRLPMLFVTRQEARDYAQGRYGYLKDRPDLRAEPFGWRLPTTVRVAVSPLLAERERS